MSLVISVVVFYMASVVRGLMALTNKQTMQETKLNTKQNLLAVYSQSKSCSAEDFQEVMDKLAGKENECEQMKKMYKELADKADECEQMKKRWEEIAKELEKALAHKKEEYEDSAEKMLNFAGRMTQNSDVENLVKFKAQNEQYKKSMEKHLQQATADKKQIQELNNKVKDLELNKSRT